MRILGVRLRDFRNIAFADLPLGEERIFLLGANAQGKSNLLEALGLVTALRSFRTRDLRALPRKGAAGCALVFELEAEGVGAIAVEIRRGPGGWEVEIDGGRIRRLADFIGRFPVVALSAGDVMLLRGGPGERRRFLDLTLSATDPAYYRALRGYHRALAGRNRLLKTRGGDAELAAFEAELAPLAMDLTGRRTGAADALAAALHRACAEVAGGAEGFGLAYRPDLPVHEAGEFVRMLRDGRERDRALGATRRGPHRDDLPFTGEAGEARDFGSDGQQRGLLASLRLAQAGYFAEKLGVAPVLLVDDVLGELDAGRRAGFWRACPPGLQVIATGTALPAPDGGPPWSVWNVEAGSFARA